ncbi:MAG TPA: toprim domain-containing protein [Acidimicrobiales bacterium]|nr:toprim domain-containing protein [Acidimicrobiales bacterium]
MLSVPYVTPAGVVAIKFRCIAEGCDCKATHGGKYDGPSGQKARLYNVAAVHEKGDTIAICEGEFDALVMHHVVGIPAVGTPGTQWLDHWPRVFSDYDRVLVIADHDVHANGDSPGIKHAKKVVASLHGAQMILPPEGCDTSEWVARDGAENVRRAVLGEE